MIMMLMLMDDDDDDDDDGDDDDDDDVLLFSYWPGLLWAVWSQCLKVRSVNRLFFD